MSPTKLQARSDWRLVRVSIKDNWPERDTYPVYTNKETFRTLRNDLLLVNSTISYRWNPGTSDGFSGDEDSRENPNLKTYETRFLSVKEIPVEISRHNNTGRRENPFRRHCDETSTSVPVVKWRGSHWKNEILVPTQPRHKNQRPEESNVEVRTLETKLFIRFCFRWPRSYKNRTTWTAPVVGYSPLTHLLPSRVRGSVWMDLKSETFYIDNPPTVYDRRKGRTPLRHGVADPRTPLYWG